MDIGVADAVQILVEVLRMKLRCHELEITSHSPFVLPKFHFNYWDDFSFGMISDAK